MASSNARLATLFGASSTRCRSAGDVCCFVNSFRSTLEFRGSISLCIICCQLSNDSCHTLFLLGSVVLLIYIHNYFCASVIAGFVGAHVYYYVFVFYVVILVGYVVTIVCFVGSIIFVAEISGG